MHLLAEMRSRREQTIEKRNRLNRMTENRNPHKPMVDSQNLHKGMAIKRQEVRSSKSEAVAMVEMKFEHRVVKSKFTRHSSAN